MGFVTCLCAQSGWNSSALRGLQGHGKPHTPCGSTPDPNSRHRRECSAITYMAMGFWPRSFPVGGMYVKGVGRLTKVNPFTATGRIYTSPKRPSRWPRTYIYVLPQFRFFAFVIVRSPTWLLLHVSKVSSSSVR